MAPKLKVADLEAKLKAKEAELQATQASLTKTEASRAKLKQYLEAFREQAVSTTQIITQYQRLQQDHNSLQAEHQCLQKKHERLLQSPLPSADVNGAAAAEGAKLCLAAAAPEGQDSAVPKVVQLEKQLQEERGLRQQLQEHCTHLQEEQQQQAERLREQLKREREHWLQEQQREQEQGQGAVWASVGGCRQPLQPVPSVGEVQEQLLQQQRLNENLRAQLQAALGAQTETSTLPARQAVPSSAARNQTATARPAKVENPAATAWQRWRGGSSGAATAPDTAAASAVAAASCSEGDSDSDSGGDIVGGSTRGGSAPGLGTRAAPQRRQQEQRWSEREAREQAQREQEAREQAQREQEAREQAQREQEAREQAQREREERLAREVIAAQLQRSAAEASLEAAQRQVVELQRRDAAVQEDMEQLRAQLQALQVLVEEHSAALGRQSEHWQHHRSQLDSHQAQLGGHEAELKRQDRELATVAQAARHQAEELRWLWEARESDAAAGQVLVARVGAMEEGGEALRGRLDGVTGQLRGISRTHTILRKAFGGGGDGEEGEDTRVTDWLSEPPAPYRQAHPPPQLHYNMSARWDVQGHVTTRDAGPIAVPHRDLREGLRQKRNVYDAPEAMGGLVAREPHGFDAAAAVGPSLPGEGDSDVEGHQDKRRRLDDPPRPQPGDGGPRACAASTGGSSGPNRQPSGGKISAIFAVSALHPSDNDHIHGSAAPAVAVGDAMEAIPGRGRGRSRPRKVRSPTELLSTLLDGKATGPAHLGKVAAASARRAVAAMRARTLLPEPLAAAVYSAILHCCRTRVSIPMPDAVAADEAPTPVRPQSEVSGAGSGVGSKFRKSALASGGFLRHLLSSGRSRRGGGAAQGGGAGGGAGCATALAEALCCLWCKPVEQQRQVIRWLLQTVKDTDRLLSEDTGPAAVTSVNGCGAVVTCSVEDLPERADEESDLGDAMVAEPDSVAALVAMGSALEPGLQRVPVALMGGLLAKQLSSVACGEMDGAGGPLGNSRAAAEGSSRAVAATALQAASLAERCAAAHALGQLFRLYGDREGLQSTELEVLHLTAEAQAAQTCSSIMPLACLLVGWPEALITTTSAVQPQPGSPPPGRVAHTAFREPGTANNERLPAMEIEVAAAVAVEPFGELLVARGREELSGDGDSEAPPDKVSALKQAPPAWNFWADLPHESQIVMEPLSVTMSTCVQLLAVERLAACCWCGGGGGNETEGSANAGTVSPLAGASTVAGLRSSAGASSSHVAVGHAGTQRSSLISRLGLAPIPVLPGGLDCQAEAVAAAALLRAVWEHQQQQQTHEAGGLPFDEGTDGSAAGEAVPVRGPVLPGVAEVLAAAGVVKGVNSGLPDGSGACTGGGEELDGVLARTVLQGGSVLLELASRLLGLVHSTLTERRLHQLRCQPLRSSLKGPADSSNGNGDGIGLSSAQLRRHSKGQQLLLVPPANSDAAYLSELGQALLLTCHLLPVDLVYDRVLRELVVCLEATGVGGVGAGRQCQHHLVVRGGERGPIAAAAVAAGESAASAAGSPVGTADWEAVGSVATAQPSLPQLHVAVESGADCTKASAGLTTEGMAPSVTAAATADADWWAVRQLVELIQDIACQALGSTPFIPMENEARCEGYLALDASTPGDCTADASLTLRLACASLCEHLAALLPALLQAGELREGKDPAADETREGAMAAAATVTSAVARVAAMCFASEPPGVRDWAGREVRLRTSEQGGEDAIDGMEKLGLAIGSSATATGPAPCLTAALWCTSTEVEVDISSRLGRAMQLLRQGKRRAQVRLTTGVEPLDGMACAVADEVGSLLPSAVVEVLLDGEGPHTNE